MQVKATPAGKVPTVTVSCDPADFEMTGPVAVVVAAQMPMSLDDLVMALLVSQAELNGLDDAGVRAEVGFVLAEKGLAGIHDMVAHDRAPLTQHGGADEIAFMAQCRALVVKAFGLAAPAISRPRVASRSIGARTLVKVAA